MINNFNKTVSKHKNLIFLVFTVILSALAISLLMWKLLDSHNVTHSKVDEEKTHINQRTGNSYEDEPIIYENAHFNLDKYRDVEGVESELKVEDMNFYSIAMLNEVLDNRPVMYPTFDEFNKPHYLNKENAVKNILLALDLIKDEYMQIHREDTISIYIENTGDSIVITQLYPKKEQVTNTWKYF